MIKKSIIVISIIALSLFFFGVHVFAEVVYLNNGDVMIGRVVEKTQKYLVLKTGKGESVVHVTIFLEDINRIETEKELDAKKQEYDLSKYFHGGIDFQAQQPFYAKENSETVDSSATIQQILSRNRELRVNGVPERRPERDLPFIKKFSEVDLSTLPKGSHVEEIKAYLERPSAEDIKYRQYAHAMQAEEEGSNVIMGIVELPKSVNVRFSSLYVYLMKQAGEAGSEKFFSGMSMPYVKISSDKIRSKEISFRVEGIPSGTYKVFAEWDITPPYIREEQQDGIRRLQYLGGKGDYIGFYPTPIHVEGDEIKTGINLSCKKPIKQDQYAPSLLIKPNFEVLDIYYRKQRNQQPQIFLVLRNSGDRIIHQLSFFIYIDGRKALEYPIQTSYLDPGQEREINISSAYYNYEGLLRREKVEKAGLMVKFKIVWALTGETEFEKHLVIYQE